MPAVNEKLYVAVGGKIYKYTLFGEVPSVASATATPAVPAKKRGPKPGVKKVKVKAKPKAKRVGRPIGSKNKPKVETVVVKLDENTSQPTVEAPVAA